MSDTACGRSAVQQHDLLLAGVCCTAAEEQREGPADDSKENSHDESDRRSCERDTVYMSGSHASRGWTERALENAGLVALTDELEVARVVHSRPALNADHRQGQAIHRS